MLALLRMALAMSLTQIVLWTSLAAVDSKWLMRLPSSCAFSAPITMLAQHPATSSLTLPKAITQSIIAVPSFASIITPTPSTLVAATPVPSLSIPALAQSAKTRPTSRPGVPRPRLCNRPLDLRPSTAKGSPSRTSGNVTRTAGALTPSAVIRNCLVASDKAPMSKLNYISRLWRQFLGRERETADLFYEFQRLKNLIRLVFNGILIVAIVALLRANCSIPRNRLNVRKLYQALKVQALRVLGDAMQIRFTQRALRWQPALSDLKKNCLAYLERFPSMHLNSYRSVLSYCGNAWQMPGMDAPSGLVRLTSLITGSAPVSFPVVNTYHENSFASDQPRANHDVDSDKTDFHGESDAHKSQAVQLELSNSADSSSSFAHPFYGLFLTEPAPAVSFNKPPFEYQLIKVDLESLSNLIKLYPSYSDAQITSTAIGGPLIQAGEASLSGNENLEQHDEIFPLRIQKSRITPLSSKDAPVAPENVVDYEQPSIGRPAEFIRRDSVDIEPFLARLRESYRGDQRDLLDNVASSAQSARYVKEKLDRTGAIRSDRASVTSTIEALKAKKAPTPVKAHNLGYPQVNPNDLRGLLPDVLGISHAEALRSPVDAATMLSTSRLLKTPTAVPDSHPTQNGCFHSDFSGKSFSDQALNPSPSISFFSHPGPLAREVIPPGLHLPLASTGQVQVSDGTKLSSTKPEVSPRKGHGSEMNQCASSDPPLPGRVARLRLVSVSYVHYPSETSKTSSLSECVEEDGVDYKDPFASTSELNDPWTSDVIDAFRKIEEDVEFKYPPGPNDSEQQEWYYRDDDKHRHVVFAEDQECTPDLTLQSPASEATLAESLDLGTRVANHQAHVRFYSDSISSILEGCDQALVAASSLHAEVRQTVRLRRYRTEIKYVEMVADQEEQLTRFQCEEAFNDEYMDVDNEILLDLDDLQAAFEDALKRSKRCKKKHEAISRKSAISEALPEESAIMDLVHNFIMTRSSVVTAELEQIERLLVEKNQHSEQYNDELSHIYERVLQLLSEYRLRCSDYLLASENRLFECEPHYESELTMQRECAYQMLPDN